MIIDGEISQNLCVKCFAQDDMGKGFARKKFHYKNSQKESGNGSMPQSKTYVCDLHTHSTASDGELSPREVVRWAKSKGIEVVALTDHDSIDGLNEANDEAERSGIKFVPGIEISTYSICEIHVLGYNIDYLNPDFAQELRKVKDFRIERNMRIGDNLRRLGISLDMDFSADGMGRKIMAKEMVEKGYCADIPDAFDRYLGIHGKAYCDVKRLTPVEAVKLIAKYGGTSSIAHPKRYLLDNRLDALLGGLKAHGLDALELYYPSHTPSDIMQLATLAKTYGLFVTGGSDYHGDEDKNFVFDLDAKVAKKLRIDVWEG